MKDDNLYVESLTIGDLKSIIKDVVREVVIEELSKINFTQIQQINPVTYPYPQYPWQNPVWCNTKVTTNTIESPCGSLGYKGKQPPVNEI